MGMNTLREMQKRWEKQYAAMQDKIDRQKAALGRCAEALHEANSALLEIAEDGNARARLAVERIDSILTPRNADSGNPRE